MARTTARLLAGLLLATALSGCFGNDDTGDAATPPPAGGDDAGNDAGSGTAPSSGSGSAPAPAPPATRADITLEDSGPIQGPFENAWTVSVPDAAYKAVAVQFNLLPAEDGAPPTARVFLSFDAPDGTSLRSVTLGLGGADRLEYTFNPGELAAGDYTLTAKAEPTDIGGIPSMGFASYEFASLTDY